MSENETVSPSVEARGRVEAQIAAFDDEVAREMADEGERADLWTEADFIVDDLRTILSALGEAERERDLLREIRDERGMQLVSHMLRLKDALSEASTWRERAERAEGALREADRPAKDWKDSGKLVGPREYDSKPAFFNVWRKTRYEDGKELRAITRAVLTGLGGEGKQEFSPSSANDALAPQEVQHGASEASGKEGGQ